MWGIRFQEGRGFKSVVKCKDEGHVNDETWNTNGRAYCLARESFALLLTYRSDIPVPVQMYRGGRDLESRESVWIQKNLCRPCIVYKLSA